MAELPLFKNMMLLKSGIEACIEKKAITPALVLIYSAIDTTGWLDSREAFTTRNDFISWVDNYLLKANPLKCTALDLYAARCGLLHTFTPDSQLSSLGRARVICYAWGEAKADVMQQAIDIKNKANDLVAVQVNDLYQAWLSGLALWGEELEKDPVRKTRVLAKAGKFFAEMGVNTMSEILSVIDGKKP
jgi:hypothetical protein